MHDLEKRSQALDPGGEATLIEVHDHTLAQQIVNDEEMQGLGLFAGEHTLVIPSAKAEQFHRALHRLGYPLPAAPTP